MRRLLTRSLIPATALVLCSPSAFAYQATRPEEARTARLSSTLPLVFEQNTGQLSSRYLYTARARGVRVALAPDGALLAVRKRTSTGPDFSVVSMTLTGADPRARLAPGDRLPGSSTYLIGNDPSKWRHDIPHYRAVKAEGIYPGIDVVYYGSEGQLEFDFVVGPGANPAMIRVGYAGAGLQIDRSTGDLVLTTTGGGELRQQRPVAYQESNGTRKPVEAEYVVSGSSVEFKLGSYDRTKPLTIDPVFVAGTYLGGSGSESGAGIAVRDRVFLSGSTEGFTFPVTDSDYSGGFTDTYLVIMDAAGTFVERSIYIGGSDSDGASSITLDTPGNIYLTGYTASRDFPNPTGVPAPAGPYNNTGFVLKLSRSGSLLYTTFMGSSVSQALTLGADTYVAGDFSWQFLDHTGMTQTTRGNSDAFVARLSSTGTMTHSVTFGTTFSDNASALTAGQNNDVYLVGTIGSPNTYCQPMPGARIGSEALIVRFDAQLNRLASICFGADQNDYGTAIAIGQNGKLYAAGSSYGNGFVPNIPPGLAGSVDAVVVVLEPDLSKFIAATTFGGTGQDTVYGLTVHPSGDAIIVGQSYSSDLPVTPSSLRVVYSWGEGFISRLNLLRPEDSATLVYSTFVGGMDADLVRAIASLEGDVYLTGYASPGLSVNPPTQPVFQRNTGSWMDAFYLRLNLNCTPTISNIPTSALPAGGAVLTLNVTIDSGCGWSLINSSPGMMSVSSTGPIYNSGVVTVTVNSNAGSTTRSGTLWIRDQSIGISQAGAPPETALTVSPSQVSAGPAGLNGMLAIAVPQGASWTVSGGASWLKLSKLSGLGSDSVGYTVDPNTSSARSATITIATGTASTGFRVDQNAAGPPNSPPVTSRVEPYVGTGSFVPFTASYSDANGVNDLTRVQTLFGMTPSPVGGCLVEYDRTLNRLRLMNDAGTEWAGSVAPGSTATAPLTNSSCQIAASSTSVTFSSTQLRMTVFVTFKTPARRNIYLNAFDLAGATAGWTCFGTWYPGASTFQLVNRYRLFSPYSSSHLHTIDLNEYVYLGTQGFIQEGTSGRIYDVPGYHPYGSMVPIYRLYFVDGRRHFWTADRTEYEVLIRNKAYQSEGIDGFFVPLGTPGAIPLYRLRFCCASPVVHHWTSDLNEYNTLGNNGWAKEGVAGYMLPAQ